MWAAVLPSLCLEHGVGKAEQSEKELDTEGRDARRCSDCAAAVYRLLLSLCLPPSCSFSLSVCRSSLVSVSWGGGTIFFLRGGCLAPVLSVVWIFSNPTSVLSPL